MLSYLHYLTLGLISTHSVTYAATEKSNVGIDENVLKMVGYRALIRLILYVFSTVPRVMRPFLFMHPFFMVKRVPDVAWGTFNFWLAEQAGYYR